MNPTMQFQQATDENRSDAAAAILFARSEKKCGRISERHWDYASRAEGKHKGPLRSCRKADQATRAAPYVKDSLKFRMGRGFGTLPISENERVAWALHGDENFDRFLESLRGAGGLEKATCTGEGYPELIMNRGFGRSCASPVDKLYTYAHQQFDDALLQHIKSGSNAEVSSMLQNVSNAHQLADSTGTTLLHFAAKYGNQDLARHLINLGATVDARNRHCETSLVYAVEAGEEAMVQLLLEYGADILLPGFRYCALGKALSDRQNVNANIVTALLDRVTVESLEASEYAKTKQFHNSCQLYHFVSLQNVEITRILLRRGSAVDAKSEVEGTALHVAARLLDLEHVRLLTEFGADVNARKNDGNTPITSIQNFGDQDRALAIVQLLVGAGATLIDSSSPVKTMGWPLLMKGNREIVRAALQCPIDLRSANDIGLSPLHYLARNRHADVLEELRGFDFGDVRCGIDATLLHHAASAGNPSSVEFLLKRGDDVDARDELDRTPLIWAMRGGSSRETSNDHSRCIETLLEHGASPRFLSLSAPRALVPGLVENLALLAKPVVAYLALLEASGRAIEASVKAEVDSCPAYKTNFDSAKFQLEKMKGVWISKTVILLDFLIATDVQISLYARNARLVFNLTNVMKECDSESYYHRRLSTRFSKLCHLAEMRRKVAVVVDEVLSKMYDLNVRYVAQTIVNFVDDQALYRMLPVPE